MKPIPMKQRYPWLALARWTTEDEINFLEGLSGWRSFGCRAIDPERRRMLLMRYRDSMKARVNWGDIDTVKVEAYLKTVLGKRGNDSFKE